MSWRDELLPAEYRGVAFATKGHDLSGGQRLVVHEFPLRNTPEIQDLGSKAREIELDAVLVGADYMARRNALLAALTAGGSGRLVHPWWGVLTVFVRDWRETEQHDGAGQAGFRITFVDAGRGLVSAPLEDTAVVVATHAAALTTTSIGRVASLPRLAPGIALVARINTLKSLASGLRGLTQQLRGLANSAVIGPLSDLLRTLQTVEREINTLANLPDELGAVVAKLSGGIFDLLIRQDAEGAFELAQTAAPAPADAISTALAIQYHAAAATALASITPDHKPAALALQQRWLQRLYLLQDTATDPEYTAMQDLAQSVVAHIQRIAGLAHERVVDVPVATLPAVVLAWQYYGSLDLADDLVLRNRVAHPGFVPGGQTLERLA
jgi:prophage DNA circulation protein